jgi:hypothetical protein
MNSVWLVDADNQSPVLAETTAHLLGWPSRVVLAGLGGNLRSWQERANIPEDVQVDVWESPAIPDGADVLLAMAAGYTPHPPRKCARSGTRQTAVGQYSDSVSCGYCTGSAKQSRGPIAITNRW